MKKLVLGIWACMFSGGLLYAPCFVTCVPNLLTEQQTTQSTLGNYFKQVMQALEQLDNVYEQYKEAIKQQNELLEDLQTLNRENAIEEEHRSFLLKKANEVLGATIDSTNSREK